MPKTTEFALVEAREHPKSSGNAEDWEVANCAQSARSNKIDLPHNGCLNTADVKGVARYAIAV